MRVLAIETSFDETACAIVERAEDGLVRVLSEVKATSEEMHKKTGGAVPEVASREQLRAMIPVVKEVINDSKLEVQDVEAIVVTKGPGLIGSLLVGVESAKALALAWEKPLIPVNHLVGHLYANWVGEKAAEPQSRKAPEFPAVGLVVSGGNTSLVVMSGHGKIKLLGSTRDDAAGECFDKCARVLGLPYPGGPSIAREAMKRQETKNKKQTSHKSQTLNTKLPRPEVDGYDFSFSGLKAAVVREAQKKELNDKQRIGLAWELQEVIVEVLVSKVMRAVEEFKPKSVLLGGGVAANSRLREELRLKVKKIGKSTEFFVPLVKYCTDNAVMIGAAAVFNNTPLPVEKVKADPSLGLVEN